MIGVIEGQDLLWFAVRVKRKHAVRRRTTAAPQPRRLGSGNYTRADLIVLLEFYNVTLDGGILSFDMKDPITDQVVSFRIVGEISYRPRSRLKFSVSANFEVMP